MVSCYPKTSYEELKSFLDKRIENFGIYEGCDGAK